METSWPYFNQIHSFSAPFGVGFFNSTEATLIYNRAAVCMGCVDATDIECLQFVALQKVVGCTWTLQEMVAENGASFISLTNHKLFQLAEPYAPVIGTNLIPDDIYGLFKQGQVKPNLTMIVNYATHEAETFVEPIFYPFGYGNRNEQRQ